VVAELTTSGARGAEFCDQSGFAYRFDWGPNGLRVLAPDADVVVVVDVLRFTSAVSAAVESGCVVFPYRWADEGAADFAAEHGALLARTREHGGPSLSPTDLLTLDAGTRLVLPSPNGSALAFGARQNGAQHVLAGCLRNAAPTARAALELAAGGPIAVIAAGERWHGATGPLRPAIEDLIGAGAVLAALDPSAAASAPACSPEAAAARAAFVAARPDLHQTLATCSSGRELIMRGWEDDVANCAALNVAAVAALLQDESFSAWPPS
jgi:2-phosphosulfolactate phosphatase